MTGAHSRLAARAAVPVALVLLWQIAVSSGLLPESYASSPAGVVRALSDLNDRDVLWPSLAKSLQRAALGFLIGGGLGMVFGTIVGLSSRAETGLDATFQAFRALPHFALIPLLLIWFGIGEAPKVALIALASFFPIYLNLYKSIRGIDPRLHELAMVQKLTPWQRLTSITLPGALPGLLIGARYSLAGAWLSLIVAEQFNARSGIGFVTMQARLFSQISTIVACLFLYALIGILIDVVVRLAERNLIGWHASEAHR
ncbi:ABC transporter permease [Sphingomonas sp. dw_22]|uniref:ABC transporter permease n=1 Tax=Sphingomonas sp. dw_22 TaxID=2721175 RepID=UPI001BD271FC|nr:ABC transporter permease [Sphingomonas sp. dw_22]